MTTTTKPTLNVDPRIRTVLWGRFVAPFLAGDEPFMRQVHFSGAIDVEALLPAGDIDARYDGHRETTILGRVDDVTVLIQGWMDSANVHTRATTAAAAEKAAVELTSRAGTSPVEDTTVSIDFWQLDAGAYTTTRSIEAPVWSDIAAHYPGEVGQHLDHLVERRPNLDEGRIILWHGPPGTGKTTAIRALARAWRDRCRFQIVLDPDAIFTKASALMDVILSDNHNEDGALQWRVLVIEDADELIRHDAAARAGQALSRVLNIGDGILGQGLRVQVLLTTNEPLQSLHPALIRPGRCFAEIEFRHFTAAEARAVFGDASSRGRGLSLAELLNSEITSETWNRSSMSPPIGQYL